MVQSVMNMAALFQNIRVPHNAMPVRFTLPAPPDLSAALTPNAWLSKAQPFSSVDGPQSIVIDHLGYAYATLDNGWTAEIRPNGQVRGIQRLSGGNCGYHEGQEACGRPLGLRMDSQGLLVVAHSDRGIFGINRWNGRYAQVVNTQSLLVNNRPVGYVNDLAVRQDGTIFFTSSSSKWTHKDSHNILLEGESSGRVLVYKPHERGINRVQQLLAGLSYPSGLELAKDESYLLIAEGARAKIHKLWLDRKHPKHGQVETLAENLPGFPANIRLSPRGTLWVPMFSVRFKGKPSVLDTYGALPHMRRDLMGVPSDVFKPRYGLVVELNGDGKIVRSLHDPNGTLYTSVSQVTETATGRLYVASAEAKTIGLLSLHSIPLPVNPVQVSPAASVAKPIPSRTSLTVMEEMLNGIKKQMATMTPAQLQDVVLMLFKQVFEERVSVKKAASQMTKLSSDVRNLNQMMGKESTAPSTTGPSSSSASGTGPSSAGTGTGSGSVNDVKQTTASPGSKTTPAIDPNCVVGPACGLV